MTLLTLWDKAQPGIKSQVGQTSYETWFSALRVYAGDENTLLIQTPDAFFKNWIVEHYQNIIQDQVNALSDRRINVNFSVNTAILKETPQSTIPAFEEEFKKETAEETSLNSRFSFDNFVIGPSNRFAYAACLAVAESPAKAYNPLFIYGPVGLGKTHLMQAITHQIKKNHPSLKCFYISSEKFTNELINAIRHRSTQRFREKYRTIDVLLIDDIHFIAGKESTQEEFFHTFNALHNSRKQIIISSDRPPREIANLEERLSSRFAWGLITDIQPPDFETRVAILRKKIEREPVDVPENVISFIADQIKTNIRELEGALIRVVAYSLLEEKFVSLDMAKAVLKDMVRETESSISIEKIQQTVCDHFHLSPKELKAKRRDKNIIKPRQIAMFLSRKLTNRSLPEIGRAFGGKDHTTVLHSCKKIEGEIKDNMELKNLIDRISAHIER